VKKRVVEVTVRDERIEIDLAELDVGDISEDMDRVASQMAYWGNLWSVAVAEQEEADAAYRQWRAEIGEKIMAADAKLAEWKVKQAIESSPKFTQFKQAIAACMRNETVLKGIFEAFRVKASILQSKGAMLRAEREATGMHTPATSPRRAAERAAESEEKADALRRLNAERRGARGAKTERISVDGD